MAFCSRCGTSLPEGSKFCPACGQPAMTAAAQPEQPAALDNPIIPETEAPQQSYSAQPETEAPQQSYSAQPETEAPQQSYSAQPETEAPQQSYSAQSETEAPQQSYYAQPETQNPQQGFYAQQGAQNPQQSYYAQQGAQNPQQSYYAQQGTQNPQQGYYAQQGAQNPQQGYYAQQGAQNPQQSYYTQQQNNYGYQQNYQQSGPSYQTNPADIEENKGICVLCYLGLLLLIPLLTKPNSGYVKFHSNQGLVLMIMSIVIGILSLIPYLGWFIIAPVGYIFSLVCIIIGIINAVGGEMKPLPLIGGITLIK